MDHQKSKRFQKNIYFSFIDYNKAFDCVDHNKQLKILQEVGTPDRWPASWENCMQVKKQQLELDMEQQTSSKLGKKYIKSVYCQNARLDEAQAGIAGRNISNLRYADDTTVMGENQE